MNQSIIPSNSLHEFFYHELKAVTEKQVLQIDPDTEFYLVHLLSDYVQNEERVSLLRRQEKALALLYLEAMQTDILRAKNLLKQLGDLTLYVLAFFPERLERKGIELDYYMKLGGNSYWKLSQLCTKSIYKNRLHKVYSELAEKFSLVTDALAEISEKTRLSRYSDLLRLYERWMQTGSQRIFKKLQEYGIMPVQDLNSEPRH